tara:strand:+ start:297 stop:812 length:516 start_codon:yes stop_codon:yes gene_type:complete
VADFASLNDNNIVTNTYHIADSDASTEADGIAFCVSLYGEGNYKQFWKDGSQRARGAAKGFVYNVSENVFHAPKAFDSFVWSDEDKEYVAPMPKPTKDLVDRPFPYTDEDVMASEAIEQAVTRLFYKWDDSRGTWLASEFTVGTNDFGDKVPDPTGNDFTWNSTNSTWDAI